MPRADLHSTDECHTRKSFERPRPPFLCTKPSPPRYCITPPSANYFSTKVEVGKPLCTVDGDEAAAVRAKIEAQEKEEDASAPPPEVRVNPVCMRGAGFLI